MLTEEEKQTISDFVTKFTRPANFKLTGEFTVRRAIAFFERSFHGRTKIYPRLMESVGQNQQGHPIFMVENEPDPRKELGLFPGTSVAIFRAMMHATERAPVTVCGPFDKGPTEVWLVPLSSPPVPDGSEEPTPPPSKSESPTEG